MSNSLDFVSAVIAVENPRTTTAALQNILAGYPELRARIARHPNAPSYLAAPAVGETMVPAQDVMDPIPVPSGNTADAEDLPVRPALPLPLDGSTAPSQPPANPYPPIFVGDELPAPPATGAIVSPSPPAQINQRARGSRRGSQSLHRGIIAGACVLVLIVGVIFGVPSVRELIFIPGGSATPAPASPDPALPPTVASESATPNCVKPSPDTVKYALEFVSDDSLPNGNGYDRGWLSAAMVGDVLAIERPSYTNHVPTGIEIATVTVIEGGTPAGGTYDQEVSDKASREASIGCLPGLLPPKPDLTCRKADLSPIPDVADESFRKKTIAKATVFEVGDGYQIIAAQLKNGQTKAWAYNPNIGDRGWLAPISSRWKGSGTPDYKAIPWGPVARSAAIACLGS